MSDQIADQAATMQKMLADMMARTQHAQPPQAVPVQFATQPPMMGAPMMPQAQPMMGQMVAAGAARPAALLVAVTIPTPEGDVSGYLQLSQEALAAPQAAIMQLLAQGWPIRVSRGYGNGGGGGGGFRSGGGGGGGWGRGNGGGWNRGGWR